MIIGNVQVNETELRIKLFQKYAELARLNKDEIIKESQSKRYKDYFEIGGVEKYDKNDYERVLEKFKSKDKEVRSHERLHASLANTTSSIHYSYQKGPDGKMYVVGGYIRLDTSMPKDTKEAINKLNSIQKSASANSDLSGADASIAMSANIMKAKLLQIRPDS